MSHAGGAAWIGLCLLLFTSTQASGQARVDVSVSGQLVTGAALASSEATLLTNRVPTGSPTRLFQADTRVASVAGIELRSSVRLSQGWRLEGGVGYARPSLEVALTSDIEGADNLMATTRLTQVVVDGALVHRWDRRRLSPFVLAGVGYLRQLDSVRTTVGTGQVYLAGGGILYGLGTARPGVGHRLRARADARLVSYRGGLPLLDERGAGVVAGVGLTLALW